jgi:hypothetical protein
MARLFFEEGDSFRRLLTLVDRIIHRGDQALNDVRGGSSR